MGPDWVSYIARVAATYFVHIGCKTVEKAQRYRLAATWRSCGCQKNPTLEKDGGNSKLSLMKQKRGSS